MTSLEGVPLGVVVGADLHVGVAGGNRGLPLLTLADGAVINVSLLPKSAPQPRTGPLSTHWASFPVR
jgi:hypothetical protein